MELQLDGGLNGIVAGNEVYVQMLSFDLQQELHTNNKYLKIQRLMMALSSSSMLVAISMASLALVAGTLSVIVTDSSWIKRNRHTWVRNNYTVLCVTGHTLSS